MCVCVLFCFYCILLLLFFLFVCMWVVFFLEGGGCLSFYYYFFGGEEEGGGRGDKGGSLISFWNRMCQDRKLLLSFASVLISLNVWPESFFGSHLGRQYSQTRRTRHTFFFFGRKKDKLNFSVKTRLYLSDETTSRIPLFLH